MAAIERIRQSVDGTSKIMREILVSTQAQKEASKHVTTAMMEMNRVTGEVRAATAEQAKGSAHAGWPRLRLPSFLLIPPRFGCCVNACSSPRWKSTV